MNAEADIKARRAEFLVELFLESVNPAYFAKAETQRLPFDFILGIKQPGNGVRNFAVEVKHSDKPLAGAFNFLVSNEQREYLTASDMPVLLFVVDPKQNQLFYNFGSEIESVQSTRRANLREVALPLKPVGAPKAFLQEILRDAP